jgi:hypothetical protein
MPTFNRALGSLTNTPTPLITYSGSKSLVLNSVSFANTDASVVQNVLVTVTVGGITKFINKGAAVPVAGTFCLRPETQIILLPGDAINAYTTGGVAVDYYITTTEV